MTQRGNVLFPAGRGSVAASVRPIGEPPAVSRSSAGEVEESGRPDRNRPGHLSLFLSLLLLLACAFGRTGPAGATPSGAAAPFPVAAAETLFMTGFSRIQELYLQPVNLPRLVSDGLAGLRVLEPVLGIEATETVIRLLLDGQVRSEFTRPAAGDPVAWGRLVARVLERGREISPALAQASLESLYQAVFDALMLDLDTYSRYTGQSRATKERAQREGYGGIGVSLTPGEPTGNGGLRVAELDPHGTAIRAGVRIGEELVSIDGKGVRKLSPRTAEDRLRGLIGSIVMVGVRDSGGQTRLLTLRREAVIANSVTLALEETLAIFRIERFNAATATHLREAVRSARRTLGAKASGYVLDLRGNPGGLLDQAAEVADLFINRGRILATEGRHPDSMQTFDASEGDVLEGLPLVVLLDGRSASASEVLAAALQDTTRAVLIGATSFGKGNVQTVSRLPNNGELFLTWSRLHAPSGYTFHRQGVVPTLCTSRNEDPETLLAHLRQGRGSLSPAVLGLRLAAPDDEKALAAIRDICPARQHRPEWDLPLARQILATPALYRQALSLPQTTVAQR